jgi:hypothetical protein
MKTPPCSISKFRIVNSTHKILLACTLAGGFALNVFGQASNINVSGMANPWLADATSAAGGDTAPAQSPVLVTLAQISEGDELVFTATGSVQYGGGTPTDTPDGDAGGFRSLFHLFDPSNGGPENGIAGLNAPANSLVGVFLGPLPPAPGPTPPPFFNFAPDGNVPGSIDYNGLEPAIARPFFIGDGRNASGVHQRVKVPAGATRLFLGAMDGSGWNNNSGSFMVTVQLAGSVPEPPQHGGLSATVFTVNESSSPTANVTDTVLRFAAQQTGNPAGLAVRVQTTTTPANEASWTDLPNDSGQMTRDTLTNAFVLNSTNYPLQNGIYFRAISSAPRYPDSTSNQVGPFNLASSVPHLGPISLDISANNMIADLYFGAAQTPPVTGVLMRIQSSTTPANEASWSDLADGQSGHMQPRNTVGQFFLFANGLPEITGIYFRTIASSTTPGSIDSISRPRGPFTLTGDTPPTVNLVPPASLNGDDGHDPEHPILREAGAFNFRATVTVPAQRQVRSLVLQVDGSTVERFGTGSSNGSVDYTTNVIGDHVLEAIAIDDLGGRSRAGTGARYIRIVPGGSFTNREEPANGTTAPTLAGKVFTVANSGGLWDDPSTWRDSHGNSGVPGQNDFAVIGTATVRIEQSTPGQLHLVKSLSLTGGRLTGSAVVDVLGIATISAGSVDSFIALFIREGAVLDMTNSADVQLSGFITNEGTWNMHGSGGLTGGTRFLNHGILNWQTPLQRPQQAGLNPNADSRKIQAASFSNSGTIRGNAGLITNDGGSLITNDGGSIVAQGGGNIVAQGGGNIVAQGGGNIISTNGGGFAKTGSLPDGSSAPGFTQTGGETDLSACNFSGPVTLNGGVLSGSGVINGDVSNNGGFISPGHPAGFLGIVGSFTQGEQGTLIVENGGAAPSQFDHISILGAAQLGGRLNLHDINGYTPDPADTFSPLGATSTTGSFSSVSSNAQVTVGPDGILVMVDPNAAAPLSGQPLNISTRLQIQSGDNVLIAGFIIAGPAGSTKQVLIRGIGPSLADFGVPGTISDPLLEVHKSDGSVVTNDNWADASNAGEIPAGFAPTNHLESAIYAELSPGTYTAIVKGAHAETGVGLAEVYDFGTASAARLANISTRGFVSTGDNVMIGGFIIGGGEPAKVLVRAIGPSLTQFGVEGALQATTLELHDANGSVISNDGWRSTQESEIIATTIPPADDRESAILATLVPGSYTAIVRGKNDTTGVAIVEAYNLQ